MNQQRLNSIAYRMLGSSADAEDIVQEALLRLHGKQQEQADVRSEEAFLVRTVSNLCIDRLRKLKTEREAYTGPWLPEPPPPDWHDDPERSAELADELSLGFMLLLEKLAPAERAVFVLRQAYELSHAEIAELLGLSEANARQRFRRARAALAADGPVDAEARRTEHRALLEQLMFAVATNDVAALARLFSEDAVARTDGGGVVSAARIPIEGNQRIAQVMMHLAHKNAAEEEFELRIPIIAGTVSLAILQAGKMHSLMQIQTEGDLVSELLIMRNPEKLGRVERWLAETEHGVL